ncbi:hypothetical protein [Rufibacter immobilis]|uniref:hypothetical protein n=1 Tax=Rufibacter immobilis TaxID=1348778 RepID=UPI0035E7D5C9
MRIINNVLLLDYADLVDKYGITRGTIDCGVNKHIKGKSPSWASIKDPEDKRKRLIVYKTIPAHSRKGLPAEETLIELCRQQEAERKNISQLLMK